VIGIDPGLVATGYGCLETGSGGVAVVDSGVISTASEEHLEARLCAIHDGVRTLLEKHAPSLLVVEDLYAEYKFPRTAILMGHARGVIYLAAAQQGVAVLAMAPAEVKRAIAANGAASKAQMQRGVQMLLRLPELPRPSHVADSLSLALTGISRVLGRL
jgi:crossover junction endodeoxyribonuclease RuvC